MLELRDRVCALLQEAATSIIMPRFQNLHADEVATKTSATDLVTIADREAERFLTERLSRLIDVPVVGEEACSDQPALRAQAGAECAWTIDPIDGTNNFVKGRERFCTMVALVANGTPTHSWIYQPLTKCLYYAAQGEGAVVIDDVSRSQTTLVARPTASDVDAMIGSGNTLGVTEPRKSVIADKLRGLGGRRFPGSAGIQAVRIASGDEDYMMHGNCTPWDHAPIDLLCREAGAYAAMIDTGAAFHAAGAGPFMVAASHDIWREMAETIWQ